MWAQDPRSVVTGMRAQGRYSLDVRSSPVSVHQIRRINAPALSGFLDQVAMQLDAGTPIDAALQSIIRDSQDTALSALGASLLAYIARTGRIADAFAQHSRLFPPHVIAMIDIGHHTGRLSETFALLSRYNAEAAEVRAVARKALMYPSIAAAVTISVGAFLLIFVLPMFAKVFADLGIEIPRLTQAYFRLSSGLVEHWSVVALTAGAVLVGAMSLRWNVKGKRLFDAFVAGLPGIGPVVQALAIARLAGGLEALQRSGVSIQQSFAQFRNPTGNIWYDDAVRKAAAHMREGQGIGDAFQSTGAFPGMVTLTIRVGESSNRLGTALGKIREYYARMAKHRIQSAVQLLEPILTIVLGLFVGSVAVALFYPLISLAMNIKR